MPRSWKRENRRFALREKWLVGSLLLILCFSGAMHYSTCEDAVNVRDIEAGMTLERLVAVAKLAKEFKTKAGRYPKSELEIRMMFPETRKLAVMDAWGQPFQFFPDSQGAVRIMSRWVPEGEEGSMIFTIVVE